MQSGSYARAAISNSIMMGYQGPEIEASILPLLLDTSGTGSSALLYSAIVVMVVMLPLSFRVAFAFSFLACSAHEVLKLGPEGFHGAEFVSNLGV